MRNLAVPLAKRLGYFRARFGDAADPAIEGQGRAPDLGGGHDGVEDESEPASDLPPDGRGEVRDKAGGGRGGEHGVVQQNDVEVVQPLDFRERTQQIEVCYSLKIKGGMQ